MICLYQRSRGFTPAAPLPNPSQKFATCYITLALNTFMPRSTPLTRSELDQRLTAATREIIDHFTKSQAIQSRRLDSLDQQFATVNTKLDAIMSGELLVTRKQLQRLLHMLKKKGIEVDEAEILAA